MDITTTTAVTVAPEHETLIQEIEALWTEFKNGLAKASKYLPLATGIADAVEVGTGNGELVLPTNEAAAGLTSLADAANADNVTAALTGVKAVIAAATAIANPKTAPSPAAAAAAPVSDPPAAGGADSDPEAAATS